MAPAFVLAFTPAFAPAFTSAFTSAFAQLPRARVAHISRPRCARVCTMTLRPQDSKPWKEERDKRALESEFADTTATSAVDADMSQLNERIELLSRREKQWKEIQQQFDAISFLTGIPMLSEETGNPNYLAWTFMALSICVPSYLLYLISQSLAHLF